MQRVFLTMMWLALASSVAQAQSDTEGGAPPSTTAPEADETAPAGAAASPPQVPEPASAPELAPAAQPTSAPANSAPGEPSGSPSEAPAAPAEAAPQPVPSGYVLVPQVAPVALADWERKPKRRAPPPRPRRHGDAGAPFALALGGGFVWNDDPGYALVSPTRQRQLEVFASYDIWELTKRLVVSLGASLRRHHAEEDLLELADHTLQAELLARFALKSWLWPHVRASVGAVWTRLVLDGAGQAGAIDERDTALASSFGGGVTLRTPTRTFETREGRFASLSLGLLVEGGYTLAEEASFVGKPGGGTSDVSRSAVALGGLDRAAPYLRIMGVVRF